jgi:uncharacterized protein YndB with AHSA1/START domain
MSSERRIEIEVEVPATPEHAWEAIATGPGVTAWFMPTDVEGRVGGSVVHHYGADASSSGEVIAYESPRRFAYEEEFSPGEDEAGARPIATEFQIEARSGGMCVVRVVVSGFGEGDAWERAVESFSGGWRQALLSLRLYLTRFRGEAVGSINTSDTVTGAKDEIWDAFTRALGLPSAPRPRDRIATGAGDVPTLAGAVEEVDETMITLLLDQPGRGIGCFAAGGPGDEIFTIVRAQLFGPDAAEIAAREQKAWEAWFAGDPLSAHGR